jgi:ribosomal protein S27AE
MGFDFPHSGEKTMPLEKPCPKCGFPMWLDLDEWVCDECEYTEVFEDDEDLQDK